MEQELRCKYCDKYFGTSYGTVVAELKCSNSNCKATTQFKIIRADTSKDLSFAFATKEVEPKKKEIEVS